MNNKFDELTKNLAQSVTRRAVLKKFGVGLLGIALVAGTLCVTGAGGDQGGTAVTGHSDWTIVPAAIAPPFVFSGTDGNLYVRHLPLVGRITLAGVGVSIDGKISADFNGDLDGTYSGPVWAPVTLTAIVNGRNVVIFEGNATGTTVALVSKATIKLNGRGPYEGARLVLELTEIGPGNTDTYTLKGTLTPGSGN